MLVTPGCVGFLLADRFGPMLLIAAGSAVASCLVGIYISFFLNGSTGACIVLVQAVCFFAALLFSPKRGLLANRRRRAGLAVTVAD
jgi:manganese/iron transport system permease protein